MNKPDKETEHANAPSSGPKLTRRTIIQLGIGAGILGTAWYFGFSGDSRIKVVRHSQELMGTTVNITTCGIREAQCRDAISACTARMEALTSMLSTYMPDSPISRLNQQGILENAPAELLEAFALSREISDLTHGAFDPTVKPLLGLYKTVKDTGKIPEPSEISGILDLIDYRHIQIDGSTIRYTVPGTQATLGGIAKGYIVDQGIKAILDNGISNAYVEAGGDLMTVGRRQDGTFWKIGIRNPRSDDLAKMDVIEISNRAIATSGDYMRYFTEDKKIHHIINPATGFSPVVTASSSILAPTVAKADGLATATMVLGPEESTGLIEQLPDCEGYFIDKKLNKYHTSGFFT